jgi:hypothetical protein
MSEIVEATARALYECERERAAHAEDMLSIAAGKSVAYTMEPWEEVADLYRSDATKALEAACSAISWPEIHTYHAELEKGQSVYEDGGGFFVRTS